MKKKTLSIICSITMCMTLASQNLVFAIGSENESSPTPTSSVTKNPYVAEISPYSSNLPGPTNNNLEIYDVDSRKAAGQILESKNLLIAPIRQYYSNKYDDGGRTLWSTDSYSIFKYNTDTSKPTLISFLNFKNVLPSPSSYHVLSSDNVFYVPQGRFIIGYTDSFPTSRNSKIVEKYRFDVHSMGFKSPIDIVAGMGMTYDNHIVFTLASGRICSLDADLNPKSFTSLKLDGKIRNTLAVDSKNGLFINTENSMNRVMFLVDGDESNHSHKLTLDTSFGGWSCKYDNTFNLDPMVNGSGTSPTFLGLDDSDDKLIAITDGSKKMKLVVFWREEIPSDFTPITGRSPRIAGMINCDFGNPNYKKSSTEQTVRVSGNDLLVVNNRDSWLGTQFPMVSPPKGLQMFTWDTQQNKLINKWVNKDVSTPNSIPSISTPSGLIYVIGYRNFTWYLDALKLEGTDATGGGKIVFSKKLGKSYKNNSVFSAIHMGLNGELFYGTGVGFTRIVPKQ